MAKKELPAYICSHVFENTRPVMLVCKEDGDWQFLCGGEHDEDEIPRVVGINHLLDRDKTLYEVMDLEDGWEAEREEVGGEWKRSRI